MTIISHRGFWIEESEKNSIIAFERSFSNGLGTETDIRDYKGKIVISHDIADENCLLVEKFFQIYKSYDDSLPLALNIKADGLQKILQELIKKFKIENYFLFDMSLPDAVIYVKHNLRFYTRESEYEKFPLLYDMAAGVWMDEFHTHWITKERIEHHLSNGKKICIVSPELHSKNYLSVWEEYRSLAINDTSERIMICTDFPNQAREFFNG